MDGRHLGRQRRHARSGGHADPSITETLSVVRLLGRTRRTVAAGARTGGTVPGAGRRSRDRADANRRGFWDSRASPTSCPRGHQHGSSRRTGYSRQADRPQDQDPVRCDGRWRNRPLAQVSPPRSPPLPSSSRGCRYEPSGQRDGWRCAGERRHGQAPNGAAPTDRTPKGVRPPSGGPFAHRPPHRRIGCASAGPPRRRLPCRGDRRPYHDALRPRGP